MISFRISEQEIKDRINAAGIKSKQVAWLTAAAAKTAIYAAQGQYVKQGGDIWTLVKPTFAEIQGNKRVNPDTGQEIWWCKCIFCERIFLPPVQGGTREMQLEHFRPKAKVGAWPSKKVRKKFGLTQEIIADAPAENKGYYLLTYHLHNYSMACAPCNGGLKSDRFPVRGQRNLTGDSPAAMEAEEPYLIYPLADWGATPEQLFRFEYGVTLVPRATTGFERDRALVNIAFFDLNRELFIRERARSIRDFWRLLEEHRRSRSAAKRKVLQAEIDDRKSTNSSCAGCLREYHLLYESDRAEAKEIFDLTALYFGG